MLDKYGGGCSRIYSLPSFQGDDKLKIYLFLTGNRKENDKLILLYEHYRKLMFYVANQVLNDEYLAEDALQQSFIKIIGKMDQIDDIYSSKTRNYIVSIIRNYSIDLFNKRKKELSIPLEAVANTLVDDVSWQNNSWGHLAEAVDKIRVSDQEILALKYVHEYSIPAIASIHNISEATVRKRLERARNKLRIKLQGEKKEDIIG